VPTGHDSLRTLPDADPATATPNRLARSGGIRFGTARGHTLQTGQRRSAKAGGRVRPAIDTALRLLPVIFSFQEGTGPAGKRTSLRVFYWKAGINMTKRKQTETISLEYYQAKFYDENLSEYVYFSEPYLTWKGLADDLLDNLEEIAIRIEAYQRNVYDGVDNEYLGDISGKERLKQIRQGYVDKDSFTLAMLRKWIKTLIKYGTVKMLFMEGNIVKRPLRSNYEREE